MGAAESKNRHAQYDLGNMYFGGKGVKQDYVEAAKWITLSAEQGYDKAQLQLSDMYNKGQGVPIDVAESKKWADKAEQQRVEKAARVARAIDPDDLNLLQVGKAEPVCADGLIRKKYPKQSEENHEEGVTKVLYYIGKDGYALDAKIKTSSSYSSLDNATTNVMDSCTFKVSDTETLQLPFWTTVDVNWKLN